ncbi:Pyridine nucleotide-disulfide oxidoreductase [Phytophthora megakarya]|uniref:Pyridine nucleotide-disulfide oxidoreductase n=1 Tax=Phytophthora megakarya TaxID=4795 RepID=A0A225UF84_9STRA|nr:Pyridine nucleotide-disulfide oxidoreductase [Phytophthora megakarya]
MSYAYLVVALAGELKAKYSSKYVTIIEGKDKLVASDDVRDKFRTKLSTYLERLTVVLGVRLTERLAGKMEACLVTSEGFIKLQQDSDQYANMHALDIASSNPAPKRMYYFGRSHAQLTLLERRLGSMASYNRQACGNWVKR